MPDIRIEKLVAGYGKTKIVKGVDLVAREERITCVFGPNGSGKSTLIKSIVGLAPVWSGRVFYENNRLDGRPTSDTIRMGISVVNQSGNVFPHLTVWENLRMSAYTIKAKPKFEQHLNEVLDTFPTLKEKLRTKGSALSGGQRMLLSVAQALMTKPEFIFLDEPSAGLSPSAVKEVFQVLKKLRTQGKGLLLIEQNVGDALAIADHVYILVQGETAYESPAAEVPDPQSLVRIYMQS